MYPLQNVATSITPRTEEIVLHRPLPDGNEARVLLRINYRTKRASIKPLRNSQKGDYYEVDHFGFVEGNRFELWQAVARLIAEAGALAQDKLAEERPVVEETAEDKAAVAATLMTGYGPMR